MSDKVEWEVVDSPAASGGYAGQEQSQRKTRMPDAWWKWKMAGLAVTGLALVVFTLMLTGIVMLLLVGGALLSLGIARLRQLWRKQPAAPVRNDPFR